MVARAWTSRTQYKGAGGREVQNYSELSKEVGANLGYVSACLKQVNTGPSDQRCHLPHHATLPTA